jgi:hypothetical protein
MANLAGMEVGSCLDDQSALIPHFPSSPTFIRYYSSGVDIHFSSILEGFFCPVNGPLLALDDPIYALDNDHLRLIRDHCLAGVVEITAAS